MDIDSLKLRFRETYRIGNDSDGRILSNNEEMLYREFGSYPHDRLDKVWKAVRRYHTNAFYPSIGQILEALDKGDVKEYANSDNQDKFWNICKTCGCNYSLKSRLCPNCNQTLGEDETYKNDVIIGKGLKYAHDHVTCNDNCSICPYFKKSRMMRGARCPGWGKQLWEKENYKCDDCPCKFCCEEEAMHDVDHEVGSLFEYVKKTSKSFIDPAWVEIYGKHNITMGYVYNYDGNAYKNITGQYAGRSPKIDDVNWEYVGRSKS